MDDKKKAYEEKIDARLAETQAELDKLKAKADEKEAEAKIELYRRIEGLEEDRDALKDKAKEIRSASGDAWEELKSGFNDAWDRMSQSIQDARSKFE